LHGGVDRARTGDILAGRTLFKRLDNLVAVFRSVAEMLMNFAPALDTAATAAGASVARS